MCFTKTLTKIKGKLQNRGKQNNKQIQNINKCYNYLNDTKITLIQLHFGLLTSEAHIYL